MGISMITALEIFTNPGDLDIIINQENEGSKFGIGIFRGPGHNFKPMITSQPFAKNREDAVEVIRETLESIREAMTNDFENWKSLPSQSIFPASMKIDQSKVLNSDLIRWIVEELRQNQVASTYKKRALTG